MSRWPSVWCSKYYFFHDFLQNSLQKYFQSIGLFFLKNTKIKVKSFECPKSIKSLKKIILGTSDAWSTIRLSNRPSDPAWIYLRLTDFISLMCLPSTHALFKVDILKVCSYVIDALHQVYFCVLMLIRVLIDWLGKFG